VVIQPEILEEGKLLCRYRYFCRVPDGLDPNLRGLHLEIIWSFYYQSVCFVRTYRVDHYETTIDQMPVIDKITVGDEFEGGQGKLVFSRFGAAGGTRYRPGDPYAGILARTVRELLAMPDDKAPKGFGKFKLAVGGDIRRVSWDWYWRLFSVKEGVLGEDDIRHYLGKIRQEANAAVKQDLSRQGLSRVEGLLDVSREADETVFVRDASKTVELSPESGFAMVWYTSNPVARYQIVQRPQSGWINWGTNGENEYPELPSGSTIHTAYGRFASWSDEAAKMEVPVEVNTRVLRTKN
jgi:hypothetical protein